MANLFKTLEMEAFRNGITPRTKQSREWFRRKASTLRNVNRRSLMQMKPLERSSNFIVGSMVMYYYDPKHKDTLPYFDRFPLTIIVDMTSDGFHGLNLHYLPMTLRAKFLDGLLDNITNTVYNDATRFRVTYNYLKSASNMKYFQPCFKRYLASHVASQFAMVPAPEWEIATFLPTAQFEKASTAKVWRDSRQMVR